MIDAIKSLIPNAIYVGALAVELLAKGVLFVASILATIAVNMHIQLKTKKGIKYREIQIRIQEATEAVLEMQKQVMARRTANIAAQKENSKLADLVKAKQPSNVLTLGKKKDEPTES